MLVSVREVRIWQVVDVFSGSRRPRGRAPRRSPQALSGSSTRSRSGGALVLGGAMIYCFWLVIATRRLLGRNMWGLWSSSSTASSRPGAGRSASIPGWLRYSVTFLVPIAFAVTVPAQAVTSRLEWQTLVLAAVFAVVLFAFTRWFWHFGSANDTVRSA